MPIGPFANIGTTKALKVTAGSQETAGEVRGTDSIRQSAHGAPASLDENSVRHCNYLRFCRSNAVKLFLCAAAIP